jgi:antirestriction protein ArdC
MRDLYAEVTDKIIAALESGIVPWVKPWNASQPNAGAAFNAATGKAYRGINQCLLYAPEYATAGWMTFNQAKAIGANVRKGERGSMIVFFKPFAVTDRNAKPDAEGNQPERSIPVLKAFHVFNVAQIENLPGKYQPKALEARPEAERHAVAEALLSQARIEHGGDRAFYSPAAGFIRLPQAGQFNSQADFYATALHELTHWTGHAQRLAREYGKRFGDQAYAREELVAEMGAAYLCAHCGIAGKLQHASYIDSWLRILKADKRAVLVAASAAQKAADYVTRDLAAESTDAAAMMVA